VSGAELGWVSMIRSNVARTSARTEPPDPPNDVRALMLHVDLREGRHPERQDDVRGRLGERKLGPRRGDSHDLVDVTVQRERAAQDRRRGAEGMTPEPVADHGDATG
jgi:hypothetical protein